MPNGENPELQFNPRIEEADSAEDFTAKRARISQEAIDRTLSYIDHILGKKKPDQSAQED